MRRAVIVTVIGKPLTFAHFVPTSMTDNQAKERLLDYYTEREFRAGLLRMDVVDIEAMPR